MSGCWSNRSIWILLPSCQLIPSLVQPILPLPRDRGVVGVICCSNLELALNNRWNRFPNKSRTKCIMSEQTSRCSTGRCMTRRVDTLLSARNFRIGEFEIRRSSDDSFPLSLPFLSFCDTDIRSFTKNNTVLFFVPETNSIFDSFLSWSRRKSLKSLRGRDSRSEEINAFRIIGSLSLCVGQMKKKYPCLSHTKYSLF